MSTKRKHINLALIGAGGIGKIWALAIGKTKRVKLKVVVDKAREKAEEIAKEFRGTEASVNWKEAVKNKDIDACIVATPHNLLAPISKGALEVGKHVLSEKPGGVKKEEIQSNIKAARKKKVIYMIGFNHRYHPGFMMAKKIIDRGEIGKILFIRARHGFGGRPGYEKEWRLKKRISGGGELIDQGVHMIDLSRWFMGEFKDIKGFAENLFWGGNVEDNGFLLMRTKGHGVASIHVSWTNWEWIHSFEIYGTKGYLIIEGLDQRYRGPERLTLGKCDMRQGKLPKEKVYVFKSEEKHDSFSRELDAFADIILGKRISAPKGSDAYEALSIVQKVYRK